MEQAAEDGRMEFDLAVFPLETVKRALYRFADRCSFDIRQEGEKIVVLLHGLGFSSVTELERLEDRIRNEILDQSLRDSIGRETANIRTLVLANAFSNSGLIET